MGGLLFKTERLPKEQYLKLEGEVKKKLKRHNIDYFIPYYLSNKKDFGDLDVLVPAGITSENIRTWFTPTKIEKLISQVTRKSIAKIEEYNVNGSVISIKYKNFQIDFIRISDENRDIARHYYSWNDLSNLLGRLFHKFHLKFGWDGLSYFYKTEHGEIKVPITKDIEEILGFLGLSARTYFKGFTSEKEMFEYVVSSKYFNPYVYDFENTNKINRDRDKKRRVYNEFLAHIQPIKSKYPLYHTWAETNISNHIEVIDKYFPYSLIKETIKMIEQREIRRKERLEKFSGSLIMNALGITQGEEVGKAIEAFKNYTLTHTNYKDFETYLDENDKEEISLHVSVWAKSIK